MVSVHPIAQLACAVHTAQRFTVICCSDASTKSHTALARTHIIRTRCSRKLQQHQDSEFTG